MAFKSILEKRSYERNRYSERRKMCIRILGGACSACGSTTNLQFDHKNRLDKTDSIANMLWSCSIEEILIELSKCQLLCKKCHDEKTRNELGRSEHGKISMYNYHGCRCELCCSVRRSYFRDYRYRKRLRKKQVTV